MNKKTKAYIDELNRLAKEGKLETGTLDPNWYQNAMKKAEEERLKAEEIEKKRINNMKCPVCQSTDKGFVSHGRDNGIYGPGYHYSETDSYWVCHKCGVMYKDLNKPKK